MNIKQFGTYIVLSLSMVSASAFSAPTIATLEQARNESLSFLIQSQNGDGSWGDNDSEKVRYTATVLDVFKKYHVSGLVYQRGLNWLANAETNSLDSLSRQIYSLSIQGLNVSDKVDNLVAQGTETDSGVLWGALNEHSYTTLDSALALNAIMQASPNYDVTASLNYIKGRRVSSQTDSAKGSGWSFNNFQHGTKGISNVLPTSYMLLLLNKQGGNYWGQSADRYAAHWLALQQQSNGAISDGDQYADVETAVAVQALGKAKDVSGAATIVGPAYGLGLDYLVANQESDGSLGNDSYKTALMAQALYPAPQVLTDTDTDGIPDVVELVLETNPAVADANFVETGNGNNYLDTSGGYLFTEVVVGESVLINIDSVAGNLVVASGRIPTGMNLNGANKTLNGIPDTVGDYTFTYRVEQDGGKVHYGMAVILVSYPYSDTDGDGIPLSFENGYPGILSSLDSSDATLDYDGDGLKNNQEYQYGADLTSADGDGDGLEDGDEVFVYNTDPQIADSDGDGVNDGRVYYDDYLVNTPALSTSAFLRLQDAENTVAENDICCSDGKYTYSSYRSGRRGSYRRTMKFRQLPIIADNSFSTKMTRTTDAIELPLMTLSRTQASQVVWLKTPASFTYAPLLTETSNLNYPTASTVTSGFNMRADGRLELTLNRVRKSCYRKRISSWRRSYYRTYCNTSKLATVKIVPNGILAPNKNYMLSYTFYRVVQDGKPVDIISIYLNAYRISLVRLGAGPIGYNSGNYVVTGFSEWVNSLSLSSGYMLSHYAVATQFRKLQGNGMSFSKLSTHNAALDANHMRDIYNAAGGVKIN